MSNINGTLNLVLSSDSPTSTGNASLFTQVLAEPVILNSNKRYEACLVDLECPTPNPYRNRQIHITADICIFSDVNGVYKRFLGKTMNPMPTPLEQEQLQVVVPIQNWVRLAVTTFNQVTITIKDDNDVSVPVGEGKHSSISLLIREI
jgi:hypothetical protein